MVRRWTFLLAACIFLVACYTLYNSLDASNTRRKAIYDKGRREIDDLEDRLRQLETELSNNEKVINEIRANVAEKIAAGDTAKEAKSPPKQDESRISQSAPRIPAKSFAIASASLSGDVCEFSTRKIASPDVQMLDIYEILPFDNKDGGVWKQGWNITYDKNTMENKSPQLLVYVIPHSHTDPGWIKTFERYYQEQTKNILDNMVSKLPNMPDMKFMYAEMSFFERWWRDLDDSRREIVKQLVQKRQFEIVTGAWVMTDEANSHYFAALDQMIEGHQWLENHLGFKPTNHWSIDPFGLTSTMSYLLKLANFTSMAVQRVHYSVKKHFAKEKSLEFMWRPLWHTDDKADIFCHMFPFYSYDIPHTCGPDPKICCQFDFRRLPGYGVTCPWHVPPVAINDGNVEARAITLLDQYRKKAQLYRTNVLLIPLGDDFRYDTPEEWDAQFGNYKKLFDYMNSRKQWNVKAQFGTLADYFGALYDRTKTTPGQKPSEMKVLSGDFFTYADRDDHYWSGYYTSRPFYKRMDRVLQSHLRAAEILYSLALHAKESAAASSEFPAKQIFGELVDARRNLGLFQHHDGITGTAKDHVVVDYGQRMLQSIHSCRRVMAMASQFLTAKDRNSAGSFDANSFLFDFDERLPNHDSIPEKIVMNLDAASPKIMLVYNSLAQVRNDIVCIHTDTTKVEVRDETDAPLPLQVGPIIFKDRGRMEISSTVFEVCWQVSIQPISVAVYRVYRREQLPSETMAILRSSLSSLPAGVFKTESLPAGQFSLKTPFYEAAFSSSSGFLQSLKLPNSDSAVPVSLEFVKYGTTSDKDRSGAYLFLPDGPAVPLPTQDNGVLVVDGPLFSSVHVIFPQVKHTVRLSKIQSVDAQGIQITNLVDIGQESNYELVMRLKTGVKNVDRTFFTDLNGLQVVKRKYFPKIPLQGNVYPIPSAAYIEDGEHRFTLLTGQPLGVGSMDVGWLEVFLDRRLMQDDNRGLFQPVTDNKMTPEHFSIVLERLNGGASKSDDQRIGYHTLAAQYASLSLLYPTFLLYQKGQISDSKAVQTFNAFKTSLPCDVHLVNLRTLEEAQDYSRSTRNQSTLVQPKLEWALILHRFGVDCRSSTPAAVACKSTDGRVDLSNLFGDWSLSNVEETSLTLMHTLKSSVSPTDVALAPMDMKTFRVRLKQTAK